MPALDLALGLRMIGAPTNMRHILLVGAIFCQFAGDVAGPVVAEQPAVYGQTRGPYPQPG